MRLFTQTSSLAEAGPGPAARHLSHRVISDCSLLPTWGFTGFRDRPSSLGFEASCRARRLAKVSLEALQAVGPLGKCL